MKIAIATFLFLFSLHGHSQAPEYLTQNEYKGPVKSVTTETYVVNESEAPLTQNNLHPTCEVCDHFEKFDKKGRLIEKQEYLIVEPVSELEMGYCLHLDLEYKKDVLIKITAKEFEQHGMWMDKVDFENSVAQTIYSVTKDGNETITTYIDHWGEVNESYYRKGLLIKDSHQLNEYNEKGQKIKSTSIEKNATRNPKVETWEYAGDLLVKYTSMRPGNYFYGTQTEYTYYDSGELLSEKDFNLKGPSDTDKKELRSIHFYYRDGRDSLLRDVKQYDLEDVGKDFIYEYEFHPNGNVSTKTQKSQYGDVSAYESFDDRGNLIQKNAYNTSLEVYNTDTYIYDEDNQLIEKHVQDFYKNQEFSLLYRYDQYGNPTHWYREVGDKTFLLQRNQYTYF
ncbi:MAG: hypothetical protein HWE22_02365 [Flavobacteriales bacterium]|nr:hypothetical protein [Flavobacteriales bacterium]